jgi:glycerol-3-phosphate dehydrogenase (NAD(P)+)
MSRIIVLGSGAWGTAIALSLHRRGGHQLYALGAQPGVRPGDHRRGEKQALSARFSHSRRDHRHRRQRRRRRRRDRGLGRPSEFLRPTFARICALIFTRPDHRQRHQRHRGPQLPAHDPGDRRQPGGSGRAPRPAVARPLPIGAFSGPSFALEVAQGQPTALTVAFRDAAIATRIQTEFSSETLRLYTSTISSASNWAARSRT